MTRQSLIGFGFVVLVAAVAGAVMLSNSASPDAKGMLQKQVEKTTAEETTIASEESTVPRSSTSTVDYSDPEAVKAHVMKARTLGNPDAAVKIEEFASLTCSHCASFHKNAFKQLKEEYIDTDKIHFVYTDFPLNAPALEAAIVARCLPEGRYFKFLSFLFENQDKWAFNADYNKHLRQNAKLLGATDEMLNACLSNRDIRADMVARMQEAGKKYEVQSTPSFIINDGAESISGAQPFEVYKKLIEKYMTKGETESQ